MKEEDMARIGSLRSLKMLKLDYPAGHFESDKVILSLKELRNITILELGKCSLTRLKELKDSMPGVK